MRRQLLALAIATAPLLLSACAEDYGYGGYGYGGSGYYGRPYRYSGWYDGYYGSIYDGYWGRDGYYYYRRAPGERFFYRGDRDHFRYDRGGPGWRQFNHEFRPQRGWETPNWSPPRGDYGRGGYGRGGGWGHGRGHGGPR